MAEKETPKSPEADAEGAGDPTQARGTQSEGARNAQEPEDDKGKLIKTLQSKAQVLNELMAAYGVSTPEELRERLTQSPAAGDDEGEDADGADERDEIRGVEEHAARGDRVARRTIRIEKRIRELERGIVDAFVVQSVPDEDEKIAALNHYKKNKHRLKDFRAALAEVRAPRLEAEIKGLKAELTKLKREPDPNVIKAPPTHGREITTDERKERQKMRESEFDQKIAELRAQGRHSDVMTLQRKYRMDEIELIPG